MEQVPEDQVSEPNWWQLLVEGDYGTGRPRRGDICEATILSLDEHEIFVDINSKRDGIIVERDLEGVDHTYLDSLRVGDQVPVLVIGSSPNHGSVVVSLKQGLQQQDWIHAGRLQESGDAIKVQIEGVNRGGVLASFGRLQGFIPDSHLTAIPPGVRREQRDNAKQDLVGESITVAVIEVDSRRQRLILSQKAAESQHKQEVLEELHEGAVRTGIVRNLVDFGAFIGLGGIDGLLHISEIAWEHIDHPRDVLKVGQEIEVYVLDVDRDRGRIALSRKRLLPDPWEDVATRLHQGDVVDGTVTHIADFGAFVAIGEGVEGLAHVSEIPGGEQALSEISSGSEIKAEILHIDPAQQRISLRLQDKEARDHA